MGTGRSQASTGRSQRDKYADFAARMDQALTLPLAPNLTLPSPKPKPNPEPEPNPDPNLNPNPSLGPGGGQLAALEAQQPWAIGPGDRAAGSMGLDDATGWAAAAEAAASGVAARVRWRCVYE